jgi:hypothetical protein
MALNTKQLEELCKCDEDYTYWLKTYVKTYDRDNKKVLPFASFENPAYRDYIFNVLHEIHIRLEDNIPLEQKDLLILKSRQLYFSWAITTYFTWRMLFRRYSSSTLTSEKEVKIDIANNSNTLMGKIDFVMDRLPIWMQPDDDDYTKAHLRRGIISNDSWIMGDSGTEPCRSEQVDVCLADEFAFQSYTQTKLASMREGVKRSIILLSSPKGRANEFYKNYDYAIKNPTATSFKVITPHWKDRIPETQQEAYWTKKLKDYNGDIAMLEQELNHSFNGTAGIGGVFKQFASKHILTTMPDLLDTKSITVYGYLVALDFGAIAATAVLLVCTSKGIYIIDSFAREGYSPERMSTEIRTMLTKYAVPAHMLRYVGDPSGKSRSRENPEWSSFGLFAQQDIHIVPAPNRVLEGIQTINGEFYKDRLFIMDNNEELIEAIRQAVYPTDNNGRPKEDKYELPRPLIDLVDAFRYGVAYGITWGTPAQKAIIGLGNNRSVTPMDEDYDDYQTEYKHERELSYGGSVDSTNED